jgi:hypothetical protein
MSLRLASNVQCDGTPAYTPSGASTVMRGGGLSWLSANMEIHQLLYEDASPTYASMGYVKALQQVSSGELDFAAVPSFIFSLLPKLVGDNVVAIPFVGVALGVAYSFCGASGGEGCALADQPLSPNVQLVAAVLDGNLTHWLDLRRVKLNPWMWIEPYASTIGSERLIKLYSKPFGLDACQIEMAMLRRHVPAADFNALQPGDERT